MSGTPRAPYRVVLGLVGVLAVAVVGLAGVWAAALVAVGVCGGDGGEPYSDPDSPAGWVCASVADQLVWGLALVPPALAVVLVVRAVVVRRWGALGTALWLPLGLVLFVGAVLVRLPA